MSVRKCEKQKEKVEEVKAERQNVKPNKHNNSNINKEEESLQQRSAESPCMWRFVWRRLTSSVTCEEISAEGNTASLVSQRILRNQIPARFTTRELSSLVLQNTLEHSSLAAFVLENKPLQPATLSNLACISPLLRS